MILQVASISGRKNQEELVDAVARLVNGRGIRNIHVRLAGEVFDRAYAEAVREKIRAQGLDNLVELTGWRSDIHVLMTTSDLLVMPSRDEGVPNAVQEAMAIGLPVAVSRAGGMPEIVSDGETGWILGIDQPARWADRIQWCIEHSEEAEAVGRQASAYAFEHFGAERWGEEYARVIAAAVEGKARYRAT